MGSQEGVLQTAPVPSASGASGGVELVTEALLTEIMADEEAVAELQSILTPEYTVGPAQEAAENVLERAPPRGLSEDQQRRGLHAEGAQMTVAQHPPLRAPFAGCWVHCWPLGTPVQSHLPVAHNPPAGSLGLGQVNMLPEQALHVALSRMQVAQTDTHVFKIVRTLAVALGAARAEAGTVKALHAVLMQLVRHGMGDKEAYTSTGASRSNFTKWKRRVLVHTRATVCVD